MSVFMEYGPPPPDHVIWMLDIAESGPYQGQPWCAHQIVESRYDDHGEVQVRITACGFEATAVNHPRGWWTFPPGELPLAEHAIHCQAPG